MSFSEEINGKNIVLQRALPTFALAEELLQAIDESRNELLPWLSWADTNRKPEDEFAYLLNWCDKHWQEGKGYAYIIRKISNGKLLGMIDLMHVRTDWKCGEIGYWLRSSEVGHGYMHEAVALLEKETFAQGINRITIVNDVRNERSMNVAQRAGYHLDGVMRQDRLSYYENILTTNNIWSKLKEEYHPD